MSEAAQAQRRAFYRLRYYAETDAPVITIDGQEYPVLEISEGGLLFTSDNADSLVTGQSVMGTIRFPDLEGDEELLDAVVLRFDRPEVILRLNRSISFKRMIDEQRRMRATYPHLYRPNR